MAAKKKEPAPMHSIPNDQIRKRVQKYREATERTERSWWRTSDEI